MKNLVIYVHGKGGNAEEAEHFKHKPFFENADVFGFDYKAQTPWEAKEEFPRFFENKKQEYGNTILIANSIGAYFSLLAFQAAHFQKCLFVSPILDMPALIEKMMGWASVSSERLQAEREITTAFGETLSWEYYAYAKQHPILTWNSPTAILYAGRDNLTDRETVTAFAERFDCALQIYEEGEHWFHTEKQLAVLRDFVIGEAVGS